MKECQNILDFYSSDYYYIYTSLDKETWGNKKNAENYLERFWLSEEDYNSKWQTFQKKIFDLNVDFFPKMVFQRHLHLFPFLGGLLLTEEDYRILKLLMNRVGDDYFFVILNNPDVNLDTSPILRLKFPKTTTWEELMSGGFISTVLFEMPHNDYYVFGDSGEWGKYVANDLETPLDIFGVSENSSDDFIDTFITSEMNNKDVKDSIPEDFNNFYKIHWI